METIQIVLEKRLLRAADRVARERRVTRSALVRDALRLYLKRLATLERARQDRAGYTQTDDREFATWDGVTSWPEP
jgi:metal-responsive CopG/Arc/MetJ family transcriptional regulator